MTAIDVDIQCKSSCPNTSLKLFLEDPAEITQSAGEDQDVGISTAPQSHPSNVDAPGNQDMSDLPGPQLLATSVEGDDAMTGQVVEETSTPKEPSEWVSNLIDGVDTVKSMIDAVKGVSRFIAINFYVLIENFQVHPAASIAWGFMSSGIDVSASYCNKTTS